MDLDQAKEVLVNFCKTDRILRNYDTVSDYDNFCENRCIAIEIVLSELEKEKCKCITHQKEC